MTRARPDTSAGVAAVVGLVGSWAVRQGLEAAYRRRTGHAPPKANDPGVSVVQALGWAAVTAAALAATQVLVQRAFGSRG